MNVTIRSPTANGGRGGLGDELTGGRVAPTPAAVLVTDRLAVPPQPTTANAQKANEAAARAPQMDIGTIQVVLSSAQVDGEEVAIVRGQVALRRAVRRGEQVRGVARARNRSVMKLVQ